MAVPLVEVVAATAAVVVAATAAVVVAATAAVVAAVTIAVPELVAGRIAAMELATTQAVVAIPILMRMVAAVVDVAPPPVVEMTIPATGVLKAEFSRSEAGLSQLATGLLHHAQIRLWSLGFFSEILSPVTCSRYTLH